MSAHDTPEVGSGETVVECPMGCLGQGGQGVCPHCGDWHADDHSCCTTPASPDPVQPAEAGEGLSEAERALGVYGYKVNASQVVFHYDDVEHILAAREAPWAEKYAAVVGERLRTGETAYRIGAHVEAGTRCAHCAVTYATCTHDVLREYRDPKRSDGCCEKCVDGEGHITRYLAPVPGIVAEAEARAESAEAALATALREKAEDRARVEAVEALARSLVESGSLPGRFIAESIGTALAIPTATGDE